MRLRAKLCHAMCGHLKIMWTWQQRGCRCWTAAEGGFDQDAISAIAQPAFVHICQFATNHLFSYIPSQRHFPNFGKYWIYFPKHKIYHPCGIFCQPSDSVLLAHKSSFIISLESEAETIWILGVSRLRRLI